MSGLAVRALGRSGLEVTRLGVGLAALGRPAYITLGRAADFGAGRAPEAMYERTAAVLDAARAAGVRYVDTARSYGRAEEFLGRWLRERSVAPGTFTVGSKWGYRYTGEWTMDAAVHEQKELTADRFAMQVIQSRGWLGDALGLYQIHSATIESGCLDDTTLMWSLAEGRRAGLYRAVGLTLSGPRSAETLVRALDVEVNGAPLFDAVQATFNVLEPSLAAGLAAAHARGLGVLVKEGFANGRLTDGNDRPADAARLRRLRAIASGADLALDQLAVAFVLAQPFVDVLVSGAATPAQLGANVQAAQATLPAPVLGRLAEESEAPATYWATRAALPWH
jgi:aryl-alcohol dehydrogenase-like predicted oxidoreductase